MGLCKCIACPKQGNYEVGKYYGWLYAAGDVEKTAHSVVQSVSESRHVKDADGTRILFSPEEYLCYFKDIHSDDTEISIYIDRKKELLFVPEFRQEMSPFYTPLNYFSTLPVPYTKESIGQELRKVWEEYKDHPAVRVKEAEETTPFYKIAAKGKGWRAFASGRWMLKVQFISFENEMRFVYWYKRQGSYFVLNSDDRVIERILPIQASCEDVGQAVLGIFEEAGV